MRTSILSASKVVGAVLNDKLEVKERVTRIFPVVATQEAVLPYVCYRRIKLGQNSVKDGPGADSAQVVVHCFTQEYGEGVELAEAVRSALDGCQCRVGGETMRSCTLTDAGEDYDGDAFVQELIFTVKI